MLRRTIAVGVTVVLLAGCATGRAYRSGQQAARKGDWDAAVAYYRAALSHDASRVDIKIALQRARRRMGPLRVIVRPIRHPQRARDVGRPEMRLLVR